MTTSSPTSALSICTTAGTVFKHAVVGIYASISSDVTTRTIRGDRIALSEIKVAADTAFCSGEAAPIVGTAAVAVVGVSTGEQALRSTATATIFRDYWCEEATRSRSRNNGA